MKSYLTSPVARFGTLATILLASIPALTYAAPNVPPTDYKSLISLFISYILLVIPIVMLLAILFFFWGITKYIFSQGSESSKMEGKNIMVWGVVALFFMVSIYGIVYLVGGSIIPKFPTATSRGSIFQNTPENQQPINGQYLRYKYELDKTPCPEGGSC